MKVIFNIPFNISIFSHRSTDLMKTVQKLEHQLRDNSEPKAVLKLVCGWYSKHTHSHVSDCDKYLFQ